MRQWPTHDAWTTVLARRHDAQLICVTISSQGTDHSSHGQIAIQRDGLSALLQIVAPTSDPATGDNIKAYFDGIPAGTYPVTARAAPEGSSIIAAEVETGQWITMQKLLEVSGRVTLVAGIKSYTVPLDGMTLAIFDLDRCYTQLAALSVSQEQSRRAEAPREAGSASRLPSEPTGNNATLGNVLSRLRNQQSRSTNTQASTGNTQMSAAQRGAIGDRLRECWSGNKGELDYDKQVVHLQLTTDASGVVRTVALAGSDANRSGVARAFAERARRAALDPDCSKLPLSQNFLGSPQTFEITFRP